MNINFKAYDTLVLLFSNDMSKVFLTESYGKLDGIFYHNIEKINQLDLAKKIYDELDLAIKPDDYRIVASLQNIDKIQFLTVVMAFAEIEKIKDNGNNRIIQIDSLPDNCLPQLKWLIPMAVDVSVYGCEFNQILTR